MTTKQLSTQIAPARCPECEGGYVHPRAGFIGHDDECVMGMVLAYIKVNWFQHEGTIAVALGLHIVDVGDALLELLATDPDVIERDSVIGYIGHTDRIG